MTEAPRFFRQSNAHGHFSFHFHHSDSPRVYRESRLIQGSVSQRSHDIVAVQQTSDSSTLVANEGVFVAESLVPRLDHFEDFVLVFEKRASKVRAPVGLHVLSLGNDNVRVGEIRTGNSFYLILVGFGALAELDWVGLEDRLTPVVSGLDWFDLAAFAVPKPLNSLFHYNLKLLASLRQDIGLFFDLL